MSSQHPGALISRTWRQWQVCVCVCVCVRVCVRVRVRVLRSNDTPTHERQSMNCD
jgi:hypothetical protein